MSGYTSFKQLLDELSQKKLQAMYFAKGSDYYLYQQFVHLLKQAFVSSYGPNGNVVQRWGSDLKQLSDVTSLLGGGGLFSTASLVFLHEIQDAATGVKTKLADSLKSLPPDTFILVHYSLDDRRKAKWLDALGHIGRTVDLIAPDVRELPEIIKVMAAKRQKQIEMPAVLRLIQLGSGELAIIDNEIEKISVYLHDSEEVITEAVVDSVAGNIENAHVFQFVEAISQRDKKMAIQTLVEIHHQGKEGLPYLVAILYNRLTQLMALRETPEARKSINRESTSGFFLRQLTPLAKNYSLPELQDATRQLAELDLKFRLGSVDMLTSFSGWIARVL